MAKKSPLPIIPLLALAGVGFWWASKKSSEDHGFGLSGSGSGIEKCNEVYEKDPAKALRFAQRVIANRGWATPASSAEELGDRVLEVIWSAFPQCRGTVPLKINQVEWSEYINTIWGFMSGALEGSPGSWAESVGQGVGSSPRPGTRVRSYVGTRAGKKTRAS